MTSKLPAKLFVYLDEDGDESYPIANIDIDGLDNGTKVGVYILQETKTIAVERKMV